MVSLLFGNEALGTSAASRKNKITNKSREIVRNEKEEWALGWWKEERR